MLDYWSISRGIITHFTAAEFSRVDGDDASCLNLNRSSNPAILGADPAIFRDRFTFETKCPEIGLKEPWKAMDSQMDKVIPAIADQTVIQWGLGKNIGDTLIYRNEIGDTLRLKLIAGLSPSIFQGFVLISNQYFLKNFPSISGSNIFLINTGKRPNENTKDELQSVFRDYGWEMSLASERLMNFNSVANTYFSIFLALGALALILGTVGLAVVLARTLVERKKEIAILLALGFTRLNVVHLLVWEYAILLFQGVLIGFVSAIVAVLPNFISSGSNVSLFTVLLIIALILLNGIAWIILLSWSAIRNKNLIIC
jgi:putative ABC transport system permease protein